MCVKGGWLHECFCMCMNVCLCTHVYVYLCEHMCVHVCLCTCVLCACGGQRVMLRILGHNLWSYTYHIHGGIGLQSNPDVGDMACLASQLILRIPCLHFLGLESEAMHHLIQHLCGFLRIQIRVLTWIARLQTLSHLSNPSWLTLKASTATLWIKFLTHKLWGLTQATASPSFQLQGPCLCVTNGTEQTKG